MRHTWHQRHGWTRHGHKCCDAWFIFGEQSVVASCGGPSACFECEIESKEMHQLRPQYLADVLLATHTRKLSKQETRCN